MMRFKKMVAVLLAAALALTMLTACGGGGGSSPTERARYISGINAQLNSKVPGAKLSDEKDISERKAEKYKDAAENLKKFDDASAKRMAYVDDESVYVAFRMEFTKDDNETTKIEKVATKIYDLVAQQMGTNTLKTNDCKLDYAWGEEDKDKNVYIYVVVRKGNKK